MNLIKKKIEDGQKHILCTNCNKELSIVFRGLFGKEYEKVIKSNIKYISGCCFNEEYYYCDECKKYFNEKFEECK